MGLMTLLLSDFPCSCHGHMWHVVEHESMGKTSPVKDSCKAFYVQSHS